MTLSFFCADRIQIGVVSVLSQHALYHVLLGFKPETAGQGAKICAAMAIGLVL